MFKKFIFMALTVFFFIPQKALPHCEIPCGIYDDQARIEMISEHIVTIETAIKNISGLSKDNGKNYNQIVRWINTKESRANYIQEIVSQYFMWQRIRPAGQDDPKAYEKYIKQLALLHELGFYAMKAKQSLDLSNVEKLRSLLESFKAGR